MERVSVQGLQEGPVQVPAGLDELLRQAQLLLQHVIERQHRRAVSCQGCPQHRVTEDPPGPHLVSTRCFGPRGSVAPTPLAMMRYFGEVLPAP